MEILTEPKSHPENLDKLAQDVKQHDNGAGFMEAGTKVKGKPGRKSNAERAEMAKKQKEKVLGAPSSAPQGPSPASAPGIASKEIAKPAAQFISTMGVSYVGDPRAQMTPDELENLATAMGMVMDKYMPLVMNQYGAEAMLCICLGQYGLRIMAMKKVLDLERAERAKKVTEPQAPIPTKTEMGETIPVEPLKTTPENYAS